MFGDRFKHFFSLDKESVERLSVDNVTEEELMQLLEDEVRKPIKSPKNTKQFYKLASLYSKFANRIYDRARSTYYDNKKELDDEFQDKIDYLVRLTVLLKEVFKDLDKIHISRYSYSWSDTYPYFKGFNYLLVLLLRYSHDDLKAYSDSLSKLYEPGHQLTMHQCVTNEILYALPKEQVDKIYGIDKVHNRRDIKYKISKPSKLPIYKSLNHIECSAYIQDRYEEFLQVNAYYVLIAPFYYNDDWDKCTAARIFTEIDDLFVGSGKVYMDEERHLKLVDKILSNPIACHNIVKCTPTQQIQQLAERMIRRYKDDASLHIAELVKAAEQLEDKSNYFALVSEFPNLKIETPKTEEDKDIAVLRKRLLQNNDQDGEITEAIARLTVLTEFINNATDEAFKKSLDVIKEFINLNSSLAYKYSLFKSSKFDLTYYPIEREDRAIEVMKIILDVIETLNSNKRITIVKREFGYYYKDKRYELPYELRNLQIENVFRFQQMRMFAVLNKDSFVLGKCLDASRHMKAIKSLTKLELMYL